jgi:Lon protease-like protein
MPTNVSYKTPSDLPGVIPVFPLAGALLLPRALLPLNIFEPRYLAMVDDAMKGTRVIGMIQPDESKGDARSGPALFATGCAGRITQFAESGDGRNLITLEGIARFRVTEELSVTTPYRQCRVDFENFKTDFVPRLGEEAVNREELLKTLADYLKANKLEADWKDINEAQTEALVNGLSMMSPYGAREKQALLEAPDLKNRADVLVAITEMAIATSGDNDLPMQ